MLEGEFWEWSTRISLNEMRFEAVELVLEPEDLAENSHFPQPVAQPVLEVAVRMPLTDWIRYRTTYILAAATITATINC